MTGTPVAEVPATPQAAPVGSAAGLVKAPPAPVLSPIGSFEVRPLSVEPMMLPVGTVGVSDAWPRVWLRPVTGELVTVVPPGRSADIVLSTVARLPLSRNWGVRPLDSPLRSSRPLGEFSDTDEEGTLVPHVNVPALKPYRLDMVAVTLKLVLE
jgi:hypothetical protein